MNLSSKMAQADGKVTKDEKIAFKKVFNQPQKKKKTWNMSSALLEKIRPDSSSKHKKQLS